MLSNRVLAFAPIAATLLASCQSHLPPLETVPKQSGPKVADVVQHIECELTTIVNAGNIQFSEMDNARLKLRVDADSKLKELLPYLATYHFVATAQVSLEVTDVEGFTPSLSFINKVGTATLGIGAQLNGTQDRSVTINYSIDLSSLSQQSQSSYDAYMAKNCGAMKDVASHSGIGGDLGLADIVADGLLALNASELHNIYPSSGPTPPAVARQIGYKGSISIPGEGLAHFTGPTPPANPDKSVSINIDTLSGFILVAPQSAGASTQGNVTLTGVATLSAGGQSAKFLANWTGTIVPQQSNVVAPLSFSLSGNLTPTEPNSSLTQQVAKIWGYTPSVTLVGTISPNLDVLSLKAAGALTTAAGAGYGSGITTGVAPISISIYQPVTHAAATKPSAAGSSSAPGATSFGSLTDFVLVYGLNGGPTWKFSTFTGPAGSSTPLVNMNRTNTDSLSITFVAACQDFDNIKSQFNSYWDTIGPCDILGSATQQSEALGFQNNSLMLLRNFIIRPSAQ